MEPQQTHTQEINKTNSLLSVTPFSKYFAMLLFIALPFIGGYVGYVLAPVKVVEVQRLVYKSPKPSGNVGQEEIINRALLGGESLRAANPNGTPVPFIAGARFIFTPANLTFQLPTATESVFQRVVINEKRPTSTSVTINYNGGTISISNNYYLGEWTAGMPLELLSTSTIAALNQNLELGIYDSFSWDAENGYGDWTIDNEPFAVIKLITDSSLELGTIFIMDYKTEVQKKVVDTFLSSLSLIE